MSLPRRLAFIDVETTGAHPVRDRVTEVAILRIEDGRIVERWESLVNPGMSIPGMIQDLIGITNAMVADAPAFAELADTVAALLEDCVFVAHNARFDYGFIKNEFARIGREFDAPVLCTVKLSRALYPEHHRHGLDALIQRHGLSCDARHRAMGDTEVLWQFARLVDAAFAPEVLAKAAMKAMKAPPQPPGLPEGMLEAVPDCPGVYLFFADAEAPPPGRRTVPLYVGRGASLRGRVKAHFAASNRNGKEAELARQVKRLEWVETAGELGALLLETDLLRRLRPTHNRVPRSTQEVFALRLVANRKRAPIYERVSIAGTDPRSWEGLYGAFRDRREADNLLRELAQQYRLCPRRLGLEPGSGACTAYESKRCAGVCAGRETPADHDARLAGALASVRIRAWPWAGPVVVRERHEASGREAFHVLDQWCHLGTAEHAGGVAVVLAAGAPRFDVDIWRILERWLAAPANRGRVEALGP